MKIASDRYILIARIQQQAQTIKALDEKYLEQQEEIEMLETVVEQSNLIYEIAITTFDRNSRYSNIEDYPC